MDSKTLTILGIVIAIFTFSVSYQMDTETEKSINKHSQQVAKGIKTILSGLNITAAHARSAQGDMDFAKYLNTAIAKHDTDLISRLINSEPKKHIAVKALVSQISSIEKDYKDTLKKFRHYPAKE